tara:strand:- start:41 stop:949 length:909 start_codon:yes stop_codon:yes gene_type:complete
MSEDVSFLPKKDLLTLEELEIICSVFINKGIKKIRISGGEPLVRKNIIQLFERLGKKLNNSNLDELTLTTNGSQLKKYSSYLYDAGVRRVNISLDTLDEKKFHLITKKNNILSVFEGIKAAQNSKLKIKINTVVLKGINDDEIDDLILWCGENKFDLTLIETMPLGDTDILRSTNYLSLSKVKKELMKRWTLEDINFSSGGPAKYSIIKEANIKLGMITPMSNNFCSGCNRIRVTCTGKIYMCLGQNNSIDLKKALRSKQSYRSLENLIDQSIIEKPKKHNFTTAEFSGSSIIERTMNITGG